MVAILDLKVAVNLRLTRFFLSLGWQSFTISGPKPACMNNIQCFNLVTLKKMTFNDLSWQQRTLDYFRYFMAAIAAYRMIRSTAGDGIFLKIGTPK